MRKRTLLLALALLLPSQATSMTNDQMYEAGQIWAYKHRAEDAGSLLRIAKVEEIDGQKIYHVSLIGIRLRCDATATEAQHLPVSEATLRQSLTERRSSAVLFPDVEEGVAEWRRAKGGVFAISIAEIVGVLEITICSPDRAGPA